MIGKGPLPKVRAVRVVGHQNITPGVDRTPRRRAARRELPLGLGRQPRASPFTVGRRVAPGHVDHGMPAAASLEDVGARPRRLAPPRAVHRQPPLDAGHCLFDAGPRRGVELEVEDEGPPELLRVRLVGRRGDELRIVVVRALVDVDVQRLRDAHAPRGPLAVLEDLRPVRADEGLARLEEDRLDDGPVLSGGGSHLDDVAAARLRRRGVARESRAARRLLLCCCRADSETQEVKHTHAYE
mmetsp:Transcript_14653/g.38787  ORF Transcript_14653/g.38787 Transcript_14653/m.38787 type:complete len:241 (+) Transcript_14653:348-1070(+)